MKTKFITRFITGLYFDSIVLLLFNIDHSPQFKNTSNVKFMYFKLKHAGGELVWWQAIHIPI